MKKWIAGLILLVLMGCQTTNDKNSLMTEKYISYFESIMDNEIFLMHSNYYDISGEVTEGSNGKYNYFIFIDNPRVAMLEIKALAIENGVTLATSQMQPSIGLIESEKYAMVPNQVNREAGYYKGLVLSGQSDTNNLEIKLLVNFYNLDRSKNIKEFVTFNLDSEGVHFMHDAIGEDNE